MKGTKIPLIISKTLEFKVNGYEQWLRIRDGEILGFACSCRDFLMRKVFQENVEPCKHLKQIKGWLEVKNEEIDRI